MKRLLASLLLITLFCVSCGKDTVATTGDTSSEVTSSEPVSSEVTSSEVSSQPTSSEPVSSNKENNTTSSSSATSSKPSVSKNTSSKPKTTSSTPKSTSSTTQTKPPTAPTTSSTVETPKQLIVPNASQLAVIENEIARLVNNYRSSLGLAPYTIDTLVIKGARIRAKECSTRGNFGHQRPNGENALTVLDEVGFVGAGFGAENLTGFSNAVIGQDYFNCTNTELKAIAKEMFEGWKASPEHNKAMVHSMYKIMGVGVYAQYETTLQGRKDVAFYGIQLFTAPSN